MSRRPATGYRRLLVWLRPHVGLALLAGLGMLLEAAVAAAFARLIEPMLDDVFVARDPWMVQWLPLIIVLLFLLRGIGVFLGEYMTARVSRNIAHELRARCFDHLLRLPSSYFHRQVPGELVARISHYVEQVGSAVTDGGKVLLLDGLMIVGFVGVMLSISWELTLAVAIVGPAIGLVIGLVGKRYRRVGRRIQSSLADVTARTQAVINGEREIKIYGGAASERERFREVNDQNRRQNLKITATNALSTATVQFFAATALAIVLVVATRAELQLSAGQFMAFITAMLVLLPSLKRLTTVQALIQRGVVAADNIEEFLAEAVEAEGDGLRPDHVRGRLEFCGVGLRYPGREAPALSAIDLCIEAGQTVALVGPSGGGKSSLAALLPRFIEPSVGEVRLDGVPLQALDLGFLRRQLALVSQQVTLFNAPVRHNIAYGALSSASIAEVRAALTVGDAATFVDALPQGLDTPIGENGAALSGGQRQRLAIARAALKDAPILILDEATSALDNTSELAVQHALRRLRQGRTTLVIAHRLSTVIDADRILVLVDGRIVEDGDHASLMARGGMYRSLFERQAGAH
jgi:subfamily B ATP-binding cassette protein MsbA